MLLEHLEATPTPHYQSPRPAAGARAQGAARVLIVDDDPGIRRDYSEALMRAGYRVDSAPDIPASRNLVDAWRYSAHFYDLVITNNLHHEREPELTRPAHFIPMTLLVVPAPPAGPEHAERIQLAAILSRPFDPRRLPERVGTILRNNPTHQYQLSTWFPGSAGCGAADQFTG